MAPIMGQPLALVVDQTAAAMKPIPASWRALTKPVCARSAGTTVQAVPLQVLPKEYFGDENDYYRSM